MENSRRLRRDPHSHRPPNLLPKPHSSAAHKQARGPAQGHASYIETWLEETRSAEQVPMRHADKGHRHSTLKARRHRSANSEDSSIVGPASPRREYAPNSQGAHIMGNRFSLTPGHDEKRSKERKRRDRSSRSVTSDEDNSLERENGRFQKRARHKTREDKYKPNHGGPARRKPAENEPQSRRRTSADKREKRKSALATATDLMDKFSSDAIHNDRLTMKPSIQPGIFGNSKMDKAPGDLSFGEMRFLKESRTDGVPKSLPKSRSRDEKRSQHELEDIETFFSHKKHDTRGMSKTTRGQARKDTLLSTEGTDSSPRIQACGSRASGGSTTAPYSWSSSNRNLSPTHPDGLSGSPVAVCASDLSETSATPEPIRQELIATGIYRTLLEGGKPPPETGTEIATCSPGRSDIGFHAQWPRSRQASLPDAPDTRERIAQEAYVGRHSVQSQLAQRPPGSLESPRPRCSGPQEAPNNSSHGPTSALCVDNSQDIPLEKMQPHQACSPMMSPAHSGHSNQAPITAPSASKTRPPSVGGYGATPFRAQSTHSMGRPISSLGTGRWLLNTAPHIRDAYEAPSFRQPSSAFRDFKNTIPEPYLTGHGASPQREAVRERMDDYAVDREGKVPYAGDENDPSAFSSTDLEAPQAYLEPFFRQGPAQGFVSAGKVGTSERGSLRSESDRNALCLEDSPLEPVLGHVKAGCKAILDRQTHADTAHLVPATPLDSHLSHEGTTRYWKPNTYGL